MKTTVVLSLLTCLLASVPGIAEQNPDFSGHWKMVSVKSEPPMPLPETALDIKQEGLTVEIRSEWVGSSDPRAVQVRRYTTDRKECLNAGQGIKDLKGLAYFESGRLIVQGEGEGEMASGPAGGEIQDRQFYRYTLREEYSLSADQKTLTRVLKIENPDGPITITMDFAKTAR